MQCDGNPSPVLSPTKVSRLKLDHIFCRFFILFPQDPLTVAMAEIKESGALTLATQPTQTPTPQVSYFLILQSKGGIDLNLRIFWFQSGDKRTVGAKNWGQCCRSAKRDRRTGSQLGKNHPYRSQRLIILHSLCLFIFTMIHHSTDHSGPWTDNWGAKGDGRSEVRRWPDYHGGTFTFNQSKTITILLADYHRDC